MQLEGSKMRISAIIAFHFNIINHKDQNMLFIIHSFNERQKACQNR